MHTKTTSPTPSPTPSRRLSRASAAGVLGALALTGAVWHTPAHAAPAERGEPVQHAERALRTASESVPHGKAFSIDLKRRGGRRVWSVEVASRQTREYEVIVNRSGRTVVKRHRDATPDDDVRKVQRARIGARRALRIAHRRVGGRLEQVEIDTTGAARRLVWEVEFVSRNGSEVEVTVSARSGQVLRTHREAPERDD